MRIDIEESILREEEKMRSQIFTAQRLIEQWERTLPAEELLLERRKAKALNYLKKIPKVSFLKTLTEKGEKFLSSKKNDGIKQEIERIEANPSIRSVLEKHKEISWYLRRDDTAPRGFVLRGLFVHEGRCFPYCKNEEKNWKIFTESSETAEIDIASVYIEDFAINGKAKIDQSFFYPTTIREVKCASFEVKTAIFRLVEKKDRRFD